jgi:hypothetical protein
MPDFNPSLPDFRGNCNTSAGLIRLEAIFKRKPAPKLPGKGAFDPFLSFIDPCLIMGWQGFVHFFG